MKPKIYIETSIPSYLAAKRSNDIRTIANQNTTIEWWEYRRQDFELYISEFVVTEIAQGDKEASRRRMEFVIGIPELEVTEAAAELAKSLISEGSIPERSIVDAFHIAVAAVNGMDFLLTWNCSHIANASMRPVIERMCRRFGYEPPIICTPLELMED